MIRYDLICENGHEFDGWFSDSASYDAQAARGLVECTHCCSTRIKKQLMAPRVAAKSNKRDVSAPQPMAAPMVAGPVDPRMAEMMNIVRAYRAHVMEHSENVGPRFAEEARKIHYKEADARGIYGQATPDEAKDLLEEGIDVHPLPILPEDGN
jgi:hypothetical protein